METLDVKELETLTEAVGAWKSEPMRKGMTNAVLGMMLGSATKQDKEKVQKDTTDELDEGKMLSKLRDETATLIKAKLIRMKNALEATPVKAGA